MRIFSALFLFLCFVVMATAAGPKASWWQAGAGEDGLSAVLGHNASAVWDTDGGPFSVETDALLGRPALVCGKGQLTLTSRATYRNVEISCLARIVTSAERTQLPFSLILKDPDPTKPATPITLYGTFNGDLSINAAGVAQAYDLRTYDVIQPTWSDAVRAPIEKDMSALPYSQDKWVRVRCQLGDARMRIWVDDRLLVDKTQDLQTRAILQVVMQPDSRLADLSVRALSAPPALYEPIPLDGYVHDRAMLGTAVADNGLPFGKTVNVQGVPVSFVDRRGNTAPDHLDIGRSVMRQGSMDGYFWPVNYQNSFSVDPARIELRIPNGRYDAMYVVAGFDGGTNRIPVLSAMFYRPLAGFGQSFSGNIPALKAKSAAGATPLPVTLQNGKKVNLWLVKIPLDPSMLNSFSDMDTLELELTKQVRQYRSYPDPYTYGWEGAGLPSGVQVYALTLHKSELDFNLEPTVFGHVWTDPEVPGYTFAVTNNSAKDKTVTLELNATSYDKGETAKQQQTLTVKAGAQAKVTLNFSVKKNGIHQLDAVLKDSDTTWTETRYFCRLAKDTRAPEWAEGQGPMFGYWSYHGGHYTPEAEKIVKLMYQAGARGSAMGAPDPKTPAGRFMIEHKMVGGANPWPIGPQWDWAGAEPVDQAKYDAYKKSAPGLIKEVQDENPDFVTFFPEPGISPAMSAAACPPDYYGDPYELNKDEQLALRVFTNTAKAAAEGVREAWPKTKVLVPWGDPLFIVPFLRAGYPKNLLDGSALDMIGFERLPEMQLAQMSTHRLYVLKNEYKKAGFDNPQLYYEEGIFSPTEPGALTWDEQAERYSRWTLISLAYGIDRFYSGWFAFDCGNYYGAEHYGGCGIQRRIPYCDPKPGYAHFATMTRMLERSKFDKWLPTGSNTAYCLKFNRLGQSVYVLWTVRGTRQVTLTLAKDGAITVTDSMDNGTPVKSAGGKATFTVGTSPVYVTDAGDITAVSLGAPDNSDSVTWAQNRNQDTWHTGPATREAPVQKELNIASLGDGSWSNSTERDAIYEENNFDEKRFPGNMSVQTATDPERKGSFLAVHLGKQDKERFVMPYYTVLKPKTPIAIPGKAAGLGLWVKAHSDWGRVVYSLVDAKGERWISIGAKDQWNCNDPHGWASFNFDGWRYLHFEMPGSQPYDSYRDYGTTWWGSYHGDGIVDLPLKLDKIIVERRTHVLYVNDLQPADPSDVLLGELIAEYETPADATAQAVTLNKVRMPLPAGAPLPNPIAQMAKDNTLAPVTLQGVKMPDWGYDGTSAHVNFTETPDAAGYQVWVAAYPDGRGAVALGSPAKSGQQMYGLRPGIKLYLWVTYKNKDGKQSQPSNRLDIQLVDAFANK